jgi:hypothetical protein
MVQNTSIPTTGISFTQDRPLPRSPARLPRSPARLAGTLDSLAASPARLPRSPARLAGTLDSSGASPPRLPRSPARWLALCTRRARVRSPCLAVRPRWPALWTRWPPVRPALVRYPRRFLPSRPPRRLRTCLKRLSQRPLLSCLCAFPCAPLRQSRPRIATGAHTPLPRAFR